VGIFKACDIRGKYPLDLDERQALAIGRAIGTVAMKSFPGARVVLGGDARLSTPTLKSAMRDGLVESGCRVLDLGIIATPVAYFAQRYCKADAVVMVTASHNPADENGVKFAVGRMPVEPEDVAEIERIARSGSFAKGAGHAATIDAIGPYCDRLVRRFGSLPRMKVVVDAGNGCMSEIAPLVLRRCGCEVVELNCVTDGRFPGRSPNPTKTENLAEAVKIVREEGADFLAAYDGDGDRVVFADEAGEFVAPEIAGLFFALGVLRFGSGKIVYDQKSSQVLADEIRKAGGEPVMERSGHAFIKRRMLVDGALIAAEISGHYFFRETGGDDGLYATLRMIEALGRTGNKLSQFVKTVPLFHVTPDIRIPIAGDPKIVVEAVAKAYADRPIARMDGVRAQLEDGWVLVRPSVTEAAVTCRIEAGSPERLAQLLEEVLRVLTRAGGGRSAGS